MEIWGFYLYYLPAKIIAGIYTKSTSVCQLIYVYRKVRFAAKHQ
jgi:hypothetical protein